MTFALVCIAIYCVMQSLANPLNAIIGIESSASAVFCVIQAVLLFCYIKKNKLQEQYGLCKTSIPARRFLYYIPLVILATRNFWNGVAVKLSPAGTVCYIICMLCVGFVEEVLFRGLLFRAIAKDNVKEAIVVSSVTFGLGHLLNLVNGQNMELVANLCQVFVAIALGFLFVTIAYRGGSLLPCIITHSVINATSAFAGKAGLTPTKGITLNLIMMMIAVAYAFILTKTLPCESLRAPVATQRD